MNYSIKRWTRLAWFCFGLALAASLSMKWIEKDFVFNGRSFSMLELEFMPGSEKLRELLKGIDGFTRTILRYHLQLDFIFMAGVFPGIAAICMVSRDKTSSVRWRSVLFFAAVLQTLAWACDILENLLLLKWTWDEIERTSFIVFRAVVWCKWILAVGGFILAMPFLFRKKKA